MALIITIKGSSTPPTITPDDPEGLVAAFTAAGVKVTNNPEQREIVTGHRHGEHGDHEEQAVLSLEDETDVK